jgi:1-acyl-sn-glycerol-3-phosphate acyltransferase
MADIWEKNRLYKFLRPYVDACTRNSYCCVKQEGTLPADGAVIISPNHTNTLMDALVVLMSRRDRTVFAARADIFRKPKIAAILRFLKILPMARSRDSIQEIAHIREILQEIDGTLAAGVPFCIFSEGTHRPWHSLQPIRKGIARIAIDSAAQRQTYIVPAGIDYSDWFHYRARVRLRYGEPIDINALIAAHPDLHEKQLYPVIQEELYKRMSELILFFPDDENYASAVAAWEASQPRRPRWPRLLLAFLLLPLFVLSAILSLPLWATAEYLCTRIKDKAFCNTARYGAKLVGTPLILLLWGLLLFLLLPWYIALPVFAWVFHSYSFFYDWLNLLRR